jgi:hypothetical protein
MVLFLAKFKNDKQVDIVFQRMDDVLCILKLSDVPSFLDSLGRYPLQGVRVKKVDLVTSIDVRCQLVTVLF